MDDQHLVTAPQPVALEVVPSARFRARVFDPRFTTTEEDLPSGEWLLYGVPRVGDEIEDPDTGENYTVVRVAWWRGGGPPMLTVE